MRGLLKEFEAFAVRGNAIDLAVGVVLGAAFGQITTALSGNIITPVIGLLAGGIDFTTLAVTFPNGITVGYGALIQAVVNFILIAFVLFFMVKLFASLLKKRKDDKKKPAENPELKVLMEIRDALRGRGA
jgi:large conductance mechanosensitive channel